MLRVPRQVCIDFCHYYVCDITAPGSMPEDICSMRGLRRLKIQYTHMNGTLPECFTVLTSLTYLDLSRNGKGRSSGFEGKNKEALGGIS